MKLFGKNKEQILADAEKAAEIVEDGIKSGSFSEMSEKLDQLPAEREQPQFVFDSYGSAGKRAKIIISAIILLCFLPFLAIGIFVVLYSAEFLTIGIIGVAVAFAIILLNLGQIIEASKHLRFSSRYEKYAELLRFHSIELTDDIVAFSEMPQATVVKDLKKAVKLKLIPQGHFGTDNIIFITSEDAYETYLSKQAAYDHYYKKEAAERLRMKERSAEIARIISVGQSYIDKIHASRDIIKDKRITQKISQMESVVSTIFHEVDINPKQANKLGMLLDYYLPSTESLLNAYIDLDEKQVSARSIAKAKKDIENSLDTINAAFERILERFYQEQELIIASEITAMEVIMKQDGLK